MKKWKDANDVIKMIHELPVELRNIDKEMCKKPNFEHIADTCKNGNCKIKLGVIKKLRGRVNFGRGKKYEYKFLSEHKVLIYNKKGLEFIISNIEFINYFEIIR